jgi:hypothetical protein
VFFLSLGSVCFLLIPFFWLALVFDYKSLENFMFTLSQSYFVGYPVPELFGASNVDSPVSQVFRLKIFLSLALLAYALFFISLYSVEENTKRIKFLFRGIAIPLFTVVILFWLKFLGEDHIIIKTEKTELFLATTISLVLSIFLFSYSLRSKRKVISKRTLVVENVETSAKESSPSNADIQVGVMDSASNSEDESPKSGESGEEESLGSVSSIDSQPTQGNDLGNSEEGKSLDNEITQTGSEDILPIIKPGIPPNHETDDQETELNNNLQNNPVENSATIAGENTDPQEMEVPTGNNSAEDGLESSETTVGNLQVKNSNERSPT